MDKFLNYVMGIMRPLLLQMVEVNGGTDTETETVHTIVSNLL